MRIEEYVIWESMGSREMGGEGEQELHGGQHDQGEHEEAGHQHEHEHVEHPK